MKTYEITLPNGEKLLFKRSGTKTKISELADGTCFFQDGQVREYFGDGNSGNLSDFSEDSAFHIKDDFVDVLEEVL